MCAVLAISYTRIQKPKGDQLAFNKPRIFDRYSVDYQGNAGIRKIDVEATDSLNISYYAYNEKQKLIYLFFLYIKIVYQKTI